jgi:putative ABC transport system permease protein
MLPIRWRKVLRELSTSRMRTLLVVLSIAVGVFAFGLITASRIAVTRELRSSFLATNPASATLHTELFDEELIDSVERIPGVADAQGSRVINSRVQIGPDAWQDLRLYVLPEDGARPINRVTPRQGAWPVPEKALLIERASLGKTGAAVGDTVVIELPDGKQRSLPIAGLAHDLSLPPAVIAGQAFGYISIDTLNWLGQSRGYDRMQIVVSERREDEAHIQAVATTVADKIERSGRMVDVIDVPTPLQHPVEDILPTILLLLSILAVLALLMSAFLIINTIGAILAQQMRQIGVMKAIGARTQQIIQLYLGMVLIFGGLAMLVALPFGTLAATALSRFIAGQFNVDIHGLVMPLEALLLMLAASLFIPALAALPPILSTARISVRDALDGMVQAGAPRGSGQSIAPLRWIRRGLARMAGSSVSFILAFRNTFRRKGRLIRTLAALTLAGGVFISVLTVRGSLELTLDENIQAKRFDIEVRLSRPYRSERVEQLAGSIPGVVAVESWSRGRAYPLRADGSEGEEINLIALPADSDWIQPRLLEGRWLVPDDRRAIVVSSNFRLKEPDLDVGDWVTLEINEREERWQIVGVNEEFQPPLNPALGYVDYDTFTRITHESGETTSLRIETLRHDPAGHAEVVNALNAALAEEQVRVQLIRSTSEDRAIFSERFNILTAVLSMMATLIGVVGGLGLMGTMSINVIERTREIGVMRAVGASDTAIRRIVVMEGMTVGLLAWISGILLSLPISNVLCYQIGVTLLNTALIYDYAGYAVLIWLGLVLLIAAGASIIPANNAVRLTVREVLAYE